MAVLASVGFFLLTAVAACAQTSLLPANPGSFSFTGTGLATASVVNVTPPAGASFTQAWDVNVTANTAGHDVTIGATTTQPVAVGDALVATVWYRRMDTVADEANLAAVCDGMDANTRALTFALRGRSQWRKATMPFIAAEAGTQHFFIEIGFAIQDVQIGGIQLLDYGQKSVLTTTPNVVDCSSRFVLTNTGGTVWGTTTSVGVSGNAFFSTATQVNVTTAPGSLNDGECALTATLPVAVKKGEALVAVFWLARDAGSDKTKMGISGYNVVATSAPGTSLTGFAPITVDNNWKQFNVPFTADADHAANTLQFQLWCGGAVQKLDVAGIQLIDLGASITAASLTNNVFDYPGRLLSDTWRTAAQTRIQQNRMGNLTVNVQNASGAALPSVTVAAAMQKHHFGFATAANWAYYVGNPNGGQASIQNYQDALSAYSGKGLFNKYNASNYKWPTWEQSGTQTVLTNEQNWLRGHGITDIHAHNLVWPNFFNKSGSTYLDVPQDVPALSQSQMTPRVIGHIDSEVGDSTVRGLVDDWDVINEPWDSFGIQNVINGLNPNVRPDAASDAKVVTTWFTETSLDDPSPRRFVNEAGIEANAAHIYFDEENFDLSLLSSLIGDNAPVTGFGFESHFQLSSSVPPPFSATATPPVTLQTIFDGYATVSGKSLVEEVTEYDNTFTDPFLQADYMTDYMTMVFSEPNFDQFCLWGFWGGDFPGKVSGSGGAYGNIYDANWNLVPSGEAYKALVFGKWWTNTSATANSSGVATVNGFLGRYALTATSGGITKTFYADLPTTAGASVNLKLDGSSGTYHVWLYEAENAESIYAPLAVGTDPAASGGAYLSSPAGTGYSNPPTAPQARINMPDASGNVTIWVRVIANDPQSDSFYAQIDNGAWQVLSLPDGTSWHWYKWTTTTLTAGTAHVLNLGCRETTAKLDQVLVTDDPAFTP